MTRTWAGVSGDLTSWHDLKDGAPNGGGVSGTGLQLRWQAGPVPVDEDGEQRGFNGTTVEDVLAAAKDRLEFYQSGGDPPGRFNCDENIIAIGYISRALMTLRRRTERRKARGVEGTLTP